MASRTTAWVSRTNTIKRWQEGETACTRLINRSFDCARLQAQLHNERSMVILS